MIAYFIFMLLAVLSAWGVSRLTPKMPVADSSQRWFVAVAAFIGALLFAKLPFWLLGANQLRHAGSFLVSGKTVLLGLVGGYAAVELAKWYLRITAKTGDSFVVPVATAIGVGRLGCFFSSCCYGTPTNVPWAIVFSGVDDLSRHPVQLYESLFHLTMALAMLLMLRRRMYRHQLIKLYFLAYFVFRFCTEFIRPEIKWLFGLSAYQWAIVVLIPIFVWLFIRDEKAVSANHREQNLSTIE